MLFFIAECHMDGRTREPSAGDVSHGTMHRTSLRKVLTILPMSETPSTPPSRWTRILASQLVKLIICDLPN